MKKLPMRLFYSPFHKFIHKAVVAAHERSVWSDIIVVPTYPFNNLDGEPQGDRYSLTPINPLGKVPTLALDDGMVIYGSQAICEYFDSIGTGAKLFPPEGASRWDAITRLALGDTLFEVTVILSMESARAEGDRRQSVYEWLWPKVIAGLDRMERYAKTGFERFDIGQIAMLQGISYLDCRSTVFEQWDPLYPNYDWRVGRENLTAWWDETVERPSVQSHFMVDFRGDDSPEFFQENLAIVLAQQN